MARKTRGQRPRRGGFATDILKLASGTTVAQVVVLSAAPVLTRLYEPSEFGAWALFTAVTSVTTVLACLRYDLSIVLPKSDDEGAALLWGSLAVAVLTSGIVLVVFLLLPKSVLAHLGAEGISGYVPLVALATGIGGAFNALNYWHTRKRSFGNLATARVATTTVTAAAQIGGALLGSGSATTLVRGSLAGNWVATLALAVRAAVNDWRTLARALKLRGILSELRRHWRFPIYNSWTAVMNQVSWVLPALVLGSYFSSSVVGYYSLGWRILALPMSLVGTAIGQVFYQRAAVAREAGRLDVLVRGAFSVLVDVGLIPFVVLAFAGQDIFEFAFGLRWAEAGVYVQILSIYTLVWFIAAPLSNLYLVLDRQGAALWLSAVILVSRLGSLLIGGWLGDARLGLAIFAITGVVVYGYMNQFVMTESGVPWADAWRVIGRASLHAILPCGVVLAVVIADLGNAWVFAFSAGAVAASTVRAFVVWRGALVGQRPGESS